MKPSYRQWKAQIVWASRQIKELGEDQWVIQGRKLRHGNGRQPSYVIQPHPDTGELVCPCKGFSELLDCKHMQALLKWLAEGPPKEGYENLDETKRPTYPQDRPRYSASRQIMFAALPLVLRALLRSVFPLERLPQSKAGRPRIPLSDLLLCVLLRVAFNLSGDLAQSLVNDAFQHKLLRRSYKNNASAPAATTITRRMRSAELATKLLTVLDVSNDPYHGKNTIIGIDGCEFHCPTLDNSDEDSKRLLKTTTVKLHSAVDVETGMIVAATVTRGKDGEAPEALNLLIEARKKRFVTAFVADRAYPAAYILEFCEKHNIRTAIPTKITHRTLGDGIVARHARAWRDRTEDDKALYGKRQITESTNSRLKRLMGAILRGRTLEAQIVEVIGRVVVGNVMLLIESYVSGDVELPFLDDRAKRVLNPLREKLKNLPRPDLSPRFREDPDTKEAA